MNFTLYLLCTAFVVFNLNVYSQNKIALPSANNTFTNSGATPEEVSVDLYTGTANVEIPLLSLPNQSMNLAVSLQYTGGKGIKVQDYAGEVGLGWKLNAGGSVTRVVRGFPDEHEGTHESSLNYSRNGGYLNGKVGGINVASYIKNAYDYESLYSMNPALILNAGTNAVTTQQIDTEPDLFQVTTPAFSVRFTFDETGLPVFQTLGTSLKITHSNFYPNSNGNSSFKVVDGQGIEYYFGTTASSREEHTVELNEINTTYISSWYLDKIVNTSTKDTIALTYDSGPYVDINYYVWSGYRRMFGTQVEISEKEGPTLTPVRISPKYISSISSKSGFVDFRYELPFIRNDFSGYKGLTAIKLRTPSGGTVRELRFTYQNSSRLLLSSIDEYNSKNSTVWPYRKFTYHSRSLPARSSHHQDFFGFYSQNAVADIADVTFSPDLYRQAQSNPDYTKSMILTRVKYPAGMDVVIDYEMNQFYSQAGNKYGGGLRVKSISSTFLQNDTLTTNYLYTFNGESSGKVLTESYSNLSVSFETAEFGGVRKHIHYFSHIPTLIHDLNGIFIAYSKVKVISSTQDYSVHHFTNHDTDSENNFYQDMINMRFSPLIHQWSGGNETIYSSISRSGRRGHLLKTESYNKLGRLLSSIEHEYSTIQFNALKSFGITAHYFQLGPYYDINRTVYYTQPEFFHLLKTTAKQYVENNKPLVSITNYEYNTTNYKLRKVSTLNSEGENVSNSYYYTAELNAIPRLEIGELNTLTDLLINYNARDLLVHTKIENLTTGKTDENHIVYDIIPRKKKEKSYVDNSVVGEIVYDYEADGYLSSEKEIKSNLKSYGYDSEGAVVVEISNAQAQYPSDVTVRPTKYYEFFYEGFDNGQQSTRYSGRGAKVVPYTVPFVKPNNRIYLIDYLYYHGGKWHYVKKPYTDGMILNEGTHIDQVRVYPEESTIITYTYLPLVGVASQTDINGITVFYEYDGVGRLSHIKDKDGYIIKTYCYNYVDQLVDCHNIDYIPPPPVLEIMDPSGKKIATITTGSSNPDDYSFTSFELVSMLSPGGGFIAHNFLFSHAVSEVGIDPFSGYKGLDIYSPYGGYVSTGNTLNPNKEYKYMYRYNSWSTWDDGWVWEIGTFTGLTEFVVDFDEPTTVDDFMVFPVESMGIMHLYDENDIIFQTITFQ